MEQTKYDVFISYRHEKNEIADRVYDRLNLYGYEVCFDKASYSKNNKGIKKLTEELVAKLKHLPNSILLDHRLDRSTEGARTIYRELLVQKI